MTISQVSKKYNLSADTLRYYERIGLLPTVSRNSSGQRIYDDDDCRWIAFVKCMRSAGLPIEVLIEYLTLFQQGDSTIKTRLDLLKEQRKILNEKKEAIQATISRLDYKIDQYEQKILPLEKELKYHDKLGEQ